MTSNKLHFESIDDILGPRENRFFGAGFRRVEQRIFDVSISDQQAGTGFVAAKASVNYPRNWSKKTEDSELRPHLSSIDAVVFGAQLCEMYITHRYGLDAEQRRNMWFRRYQMKAGSTPQEDLDYVPIEARQIETKEIAGTRGSHLSIFDAQIGTIKIRCEIEHEINSICENGILYSDSDILLGTSDRRFYGDGYKLPVQLITQLDVDLESQRIKSRIEIKHSVEETLLDEGMEANYRPSASMIECMTAIAQMAQVLLYKLDNMDRSNSSTLWMRDATFESHSPNQPLTEFEATTHIVKSKLLKMRGGVWRTSEFIGHFQGLVLKCTLAHQLPVDSEGNQITQTTDITS